MSVNIDVTFELPDSPEAIKQLKEWRVRENLWEDFFARTPNSQHWGSSCLTNFSETWLSVHLKRDFIHDRMPARHCNWLREDQEHAEREEAQLCQVHAAESQLNHKFCAWKLWQLLASVFSLFFLVFIRLSYGHWNNRLGYEGSSLCHWVGSHRLAKMS